MRNLSVQRKNMSTVEINLVLAHAILIEIYFIIQDTWPVVPAYVTILT